MPDRLRELVEGEWLLEPADELTPIAGFGRCDRGRDHRRSRVARAEPAFRLGAGIDRGVDDEERRLRCRVPGGPVVDLRLVPEPPDNPDDEGTDLPVVFRDQHARHGVMLAVPRSPMPYFRYEAGMSGEIILVVDDERDIRALIRRLLTRAGYEVIEAETGRRALRALFASPPAAVILDVSMPDLDGFATLERIRELTNVPVLMLTGRDEETDKVRGLRGGADDYLTKPFGHEELLARIEVLLRHARHEQSTEGWADDYLTVDVAGRRVRARNVDVSLTPLEFRVLEALVRHANQVLSHAQLVQLAWDGRFVATEQVTLYVSALRRKLEAATGQEPPIETVRGFGYRYRRVGRL